MHIYIEGERYYIYIQCERGKDGGRERVCERGREGGRDSERRETERKTINLQRLTEFLHTSLKCKRRIHELQQAFTTSNDTYIEIYIYIYRDIYIYVARGTDRDRDRDRERQRERKTERERERERQRKSERENIDTEKHTRRLQSQTRAVSKEQK